MALILSKENRIQISQRLIRIKKEQEGAEIIKAQIEEQRARVQKKDDANKVLSDAKTPYIDAYQDEFQLLDGIQRTKLTEQDMLDAANKILGNTFFLNDLTAPTPSCPDGVWKKFVPLASSHAVGKNRLEAYPATGLRTEQNIMNDISAKITQIEAFAQAERITGKECLEDTSGSCSNPLYTDEPTCLLNGETWTPTLGPDYYVPHPTIPTLLTELKTLVDEWETRVLAEKAFIPLDDPNNTRQTQNNTAISDINNTKSIIDIWQAVQDYDTTTTLPSGSGGSGCAAFLAMTEGMFQPAKLSPSVLLNIKNEIIARTSFTATRQTELSTNLGSITQNLSTGYITAHTGLYGERMLIIDLRLNLMGGSLTQKVGLELGKVAQDNAIQNNENAEEAYSAVMIAHRTISPGLGTSYLTIRDGSQFAVNDRVFVVADDQEELSGAIKSINGGVIELSFIIPKKYKTTKQLRIYKLI